MGVHLLPTPLPPGTGPKLLEFLKRHAVTEMLFTPTLFNNLLTTTEPEELQENTQALKTVLLNGEVLCAVFGPTGIDM